MVWRGPSMGKDEVQDTPVKASALQTRGPSLASPHASIHPFKTSGPCASALNKPTSDS